MQSIKFIVISGVVSFAIILAISSQRTSASPTTAAPNQVKTNSNRAEEEKIPIGSDGSLFLAGTECGPNEELALGSLPTCEPTCDNPRPVCLKVFFSGLDYVPCFCKKPLVRNVKTKQCVQLRECPK